MENNRFIYPRSGPFGKLLNLIANSAFIASVRRAMLSRLPFLKLESDVVNIVYLNWVIPKSLAMAQVPAGVELAEKEGKTIFTVLTYVHGHFGPVGLGPLRKAMPSPLQSNWRLYVSSFAGQGPCKATVLFIKNIFNNPLYALGSRLFSDALPSHVAASFQHEHEESKYITDIRSGIGSSPELSAAVVATDQRQLPPEFRPFFNSWQEAILNLCQQESAICKVEGAGYLAQAGIELPIDLSTVIPAVVDRLSVGEYLENLGAVEAPFCFVVPSVKFRVLWEHIV